MPAVPVGQRPPPAVVGPPGTKRRASEAGLVDQQEAVGLRQRQGAPARRVQEVHDVSASTVAHLLSRSLFPSACVVACTTNHGDMPVLVGTLRWLHSTLTLTHDPLPLTDLE